MTKLSLPTILTAMAKSLSNAADLAADADLLLSAGRRPRAFMLLHCAAEETAKYFMLEVVARKLAHNVPINWARFWKRIYRHESKMAHVAMRLEALAGMIAPERLNLARAGNQIWWQAGITPRNQSLYVEIAGGKVSAPSDIDWSIGVEAFKALVEALLDGARAIGTTEGQIVTSLKSGPQGDFLAPLLLQLFRWRRAGLSADDVIARLERIWELTRNEKINVNAKKDAI